jgi:hypothetical protein
MRQLEHPLIPARATGSAPGAGRVSATGDYRIDVERVAPGGVVLAYTLIVSVR